MDVSRKHAAIFLGVNHNGLIAVLKDMTNAGVPRVVHFDDPVLELLHELAEIRFTRGDHQVEMIGHEREAVDIHRKQRCGFKQQVEKTVPVVIVVEDNTLLIPAVIYVVPEVCAFNAGWS
jgi:hypothetical protein